VKSPEDCRWHYALRGGRLRGRFHATDLRVRRPEPGRAVPLLLAPVSLGGNSLPVLECHLFPLQCKHSALL